jgi:hypothetical protein
MKSLFVILCIALPSSLSFADPAAPTPAPGQVVPAVPTPANTVPETVVVTSEVNTCKASANELLATCQSALNAVMDLNKSMAGVPDFVITTEMNNVVTACQAACDTRESTGIEAKLRCDDAMVRNKPTFDAAVKNQNPILTQMNTNYDGCVLKEIDKIKDQKHQADVKLATLMDGRTDVQFFDYTTQNMRCGGSIGQTAGLKCMNLSTREIVTMDRIDMVNPNYVPSLESPPGYVPIPPTRPPHETPNPPEQEVAVAPESPVATPDPSPAPSSTGGSNNGGGGSRGGGGGTGYSYSSGAPYGGTSGGGSSGYSPTPFNMGTASVPGGASEVTSSAGLGGGSSEVSSFRNGKATDSDGGGGGGGRRASSANHDSYKDRNPYSGSLPPFVAASAGGGGSLVGGTSLGQDAGHGSSYRGSGGSLSSASLMPGSQFFKPGGKYPFALGKRLTAKEKARLAKMKMKKNSRFRACNGNMTCVLAVAGMSAKQFEQLRLRAAAGNRDIASFFERNQHKRKLPSEIGSGMNDVINEVGNMVTKRFIVNDDGDLEEYVYEPGVYIHDTAPKD